jgi:L-methionine (R)-S-oxide reductase
VHGKESPVSFTPSVRADSYASMARQLAALLGDERDAVANAANTTAYLFEQLDRLNWVGFYFLQGDELVLGPFQGRVACVRIGIGKGVCGTAALRRETVVVPDVHAFEGHIACDAASNSEIVVPLRDGEKVIGVLDLASPECGRFTDEDRTGLEEIAAIWVRASDLSTLPARAR